MASSHSSHPWESPDLASGHPWERPGYDDGSSSDDPDPLTNKEEAAKRFLEVLTDLYLTSVISAKTFAVLCYWASAAGMPGDVASHAYRPDASTGNYQKHLDRTLGFDKSKAAFYELKVPGYPRSEAGRATMAVPMCPPHEAIEKECEENPAMGVLLQEKAADLPRAYAANPVVRSSATPVLPLALYMDGVSYTNSDSVVGIWVINLITGVRHIVGLLRKAVVCRCGCRGQCSWWPILVFIRWSLRACGAGRHPHERHDGRPFEADEDFRANLAGTALKFRSVVMLCKGDWSEFCERFGFPAHNSNRRPCFLCACPPGEAMYDPMGYSLLGGPWHLNSDTDYDRAAAECEIQVSVTQEHHTLLKKILRYDKRPSAKGGLVLTRGYPPLKLAAGDRLDQNDALPDTGSFFEIVTFPITLVFWRAARETLVNYRCPLWDASLGLTADATIALDLLHAYYLGPLQTWSRDVLWLLLSSGSFGGHQTEHEKLVVGLSVIKHELFKFYREYDQRHPNAPLTRVSNLTPKMLGIGGGRKKLKTKAMETLGIARFLVHMLPKYDVPRRDIFLEVGRLLLRFLDIMKTCEGYRLPLDRQQEMMDVWKSFLSAYKPLGSLPPKAHMVLHVCLRAEFQGNPSRYTTFLDESLNSTLKSVLRLCHQTSFERQGLVKFREALSRPAVRQRLR